MHKSSMVNMQKMLDKVLTGKFIARPFTVVDYGGRRFDNHDSYFSLFKNFPNAKYLSVDLEQGEGVDIVLSDPYNSPFEDNSIDIIVSGQMFEHCEFFWLTIKDMARIIKPGGYILAITPSSGAVHRYPVDCWRFYPDAYAALSKWANLQLIDAWHDTSGKWQDQVGIMRKPND